MSSSLNPIEIIFLLTRSNREMPAWWAFLLKVVQRQLWPLVKSSTSHDSTDSWDSQHHQVGSWPIGIGIQQTLLEERVALDHAIEKTWDSGLLIKQSYEFNLSFYMWCIECYSEICFRYLRCCGCSEQAQINVPEKVSGGHRQALQKWSPAFPVSELKMSTPLSKLSQPRYEIIQLQKIFKNKQTTFWKKLYRANILYCKPYLELGLCLWTQQSCWDFWGCSKFSL